MPPYRYHVKTTQTADNQLLDLLVNLPALRNAITRASNDIDHVLGMGPPNQGRLRPQPGYPTRREILINPLLVTFDYAPNGVEIVVTEMKLDPRPLHGVP